jgi:TRAP-type C4-dicarboxylate transport system permease large subunit
MGLDLHGLGPEAKAIWFGILILMVIEMGMIIPPVGLNVYIINSLAKTAPMAETYRGVIPFVVSDIIRTSLLLAFPAISLIGLKLVE